MKKKVAVVVLQYEEMKKKVAVVVLQLVVLKTFGHFDR